MYVKSTCFNVHSVFIIKPKTVSHTKTKAALLTAELIHLTEYNVMECSMTKFTFEARAV